MHTSMTSPLLESIPRFLPVRPGCATSRSLQLTVDMAPGACVYVLIPRSPQPARLCEKMPNGRDRVAGKWIVAGYPSGSETRLSGVFGGTWLFLHTIVRSC